MSDIDSSQWLQQLSHRACTHFATSATLGELLNEPWLACRAGEYLWNYTRHLFYSNRLRFIIEPLSAIVNALKQIGYERCVRPRLSPCLDDRGIISL